MMSKLMAKDDGRNKQFKPKIISKQKKRTEQEIFMTNIMTINEIIRIGI